MTQAQQSALYGPVAEDLILVEDLLESVKRVDLAPLRLMLDHALAPRGKRLRPALVLLAGTFGDYNLNRLVPLGTAIELLHTASLVHDDVVDGATSRRGRPTANAVFDNALTVLLGDFMFSNAAEMVTRTGSLPVTRLFALALMKMTSGELDQDAAAFDVGRDVQHYLWRIGGKTAALFGHSTQGGALLAACTESQVEALRSYGYNLGMAFQIVDDILDFTGDEAEMGKPAGATFSKGRSRCRRSSTWTQRRGRTPCGASSPRTGSAARSCPMRSQPWSRRTRSGARRTWRGSSWTARSRASPPWRRPTPAARSKS